jgi:hypothetical protein
MTIELSDEDKKAIINEMQILDEEAEIVWDEIDKEIPASQIADTKKVIDRMLDLLQERAPFLYNAICELEYIVSGRTAAICTNDETIWVNPTWFANRPDEEILHTVAFIAQIVLDGVNKLSDQVMAEDNPSWDTWATTCNLLANRRVLDQKIGILPTVSAFITSIDPSVGYIELYNKYKDQDYKELCKQVWPLATWL